MFGNSLRLAGDVTPGLSLACCCSLVEESAVSFVWLITLLPGWGVMTSTSFGLVFCCSGVMTQRSPSLVTLTPAWGISTNVSLALVSWVAVPGAGLGVEGSSLGMVPLMTLPPTLSPYQPSEEWGAVSHG